MRREPMNQSERDDFRLFCEQATDNQIINIVEKEREFADVDSYRAACAGIAESVASTRGLL